MRFWGFLVLMLLVIGWCCAAVVNADWYSQRYERPPVAFVDPVKDPAGLLPSGTNDPLLKISDDDDIGRKPSR
jgi:hypothetical protein